MITDRDVKRARTKKLNDYAIIKLGNHRATAVEFSNDLIVYYDTKGDIMERTSWFNVIGYFRRKKIQKIL